MKFADGRPTYKEIGALLGISRARVQQLEHRALKKIRAAILADRAFVQEVLDFDFQIDKEVLHVGAQQKDR